MGCDKRFMKVGGERLIDAAVRTLTKVFPRTLMVVGQGGAILLSDQSWPEGLEIIEDRIPDAGPMGGLLTGLDRLEVEFGFVVASDMPFLDEPFIRRLATAPSRHKLVVPRDSSGWHPLHARYHESLAPILRSRLNSGRRRLQGLFEEIPPWPIEVRPISGSSPRPDPLANLNTPGDLHRLGSVSADRPSDDEVIPGPGVKGS